MKTILIGFSKSESPGLISRLQMWYFDIRYSHAYIRFHIKPVTGELILHATSMGMHVVSATTFMRNRTPVFEFPIHCGEGCYRAFVKDAFDTTGKPYGTKQMLGAGLAKVFKLKKNPFGNVDETFCSKAVGNKLEKFFGFDIPGDPNLWTPKDICTFMQKAKHD